MGRYINEKKDGTPLGLRKVDDLIADGAEKIAPPLSFIEDLVCVAHHTTHQAAGYMYSESEFKYWRDETPGLEKTWLIYPGVKELAK